MICLYFGASDRLISIEESQHLNSYIGVVKESRISISLTVNDQQQRSLRGQDPGSFNGPD